MPWPWLASGAGPGVTLGERAGDRTRAGVLALELVWVLDGAEARASGSSPTSTSSGPLVIRRVRGTRPLGDLPWVVVRCGCGFRLMVAAASAAVAVAVALLRHLAPCTLLGVSPPMSAAAWAAPDVGPVILPHSQAAAVRPITAHVMFTKGPVLVSSCRGEARRGEALTLHAATFPAPFALPFNSPRDLPAAHSPATRLQLQHTVPPGRAPPRHAAITEPRHCRHQGHTHFFHLGRTGTVDALDPPSPGRRHENRQGGCPHTEHRRSRLAVAVARPPGAGLQPRGLWQRAASEAVPRPRDGPLVRGHDGRPDLPRDDAASGRQAHLYVPVPAEQRDETRRDAIHTKTRQC